MGEGTDTSHVKGGELKKLLKLYEHKGYFIASLVVSFFCGLVPLFINLMMGEFTNLIVDETDFLAGARRLILQMFGLDMLNCVIWLVQIYLVGIAGPYFINDFRRILYHHLMDIDIEFFDLNKPGEIMSRLTSDVALMNEVLITRSGEVFAVIVQATAGLILALSVSWQVTLSVIIAVPISICAFLVGERIVDRIWESFNASTADAGAKAEQVISSFRTVKSFDKELYEAESYRVSLGEIKDVYYKTSKIHGTKDAVINLCIVAMMMGFMYFCGWAMENKPSWGINPGTIYILNSALIFDVMGISQVLSIADQYKKAIVSASEVLRIIETEIKIKNEEGKDLKEQMKGRIEFKDVKFRYASRDDYALNGLSLTIEPGETAAFIGESGCGKSTTLQLLQRFYDVESGSILVDGTDIRELSPLYLRSQVSIVPQTPVLFSMSILENVRYARPDATPAEAEEAARLGNAHNFITKMNEGYETVVEQTSLSGGQKQRICISRAILCNSPILLLDEATAALDTESEKLVQESLEKIRKGKTAIIVAHRLATVKNADKIFVFKEGKIDDFGTHDQLLARGGIYADLIKYQLQ